MPFLNPHAADSPDQLRQLASWYRELAERAGNVWIWEARLRTAEDLEAEARRTLPRKTGEDRSPVETALGA
jgi:hypothetical protein